MVLEVADDTVVNWVATRFGHTDLVTKIFFHSRPLVRDFVRPSPWVDFTKIIQKISVELGLYGTSRPVSKSGKFSKSELSGNGMFSFPDASDTQIS